MNYNVLLCRFDFLDFREYSTVPGQSEDTSTAATASGGQVSPSHARNSHLMVNSSPLTVSRRSTESSPKRSHPRRDTTDGGMKNSSEIASHRVFHDGIAEALLKDAEMSRKLSSESESSGGSGGGSIGEEGEVREGVAAVDSKKKNSNSGPSELTVR